jgi:Domain of unknown function (DUF4169)
MGDLIHLGRVRKRKAAERKAAEADANAVRHGRSRGERERAAAEARHAQDHLDGALREPTSSHADEPAATDERDPTP